MENIITFWFIIGILLLLSEFLIPGFIIFFFGLGAMITSLILLIFPPIRELFPLQIITFTTVSIVSLFSLRRKFKVTLKGDLFQERDDYTNKQCIVTESVSPEKPGRIKFQGTTWAAECIEGKFKKNKHAIIIGKKEDNPMVFLIKNIN